MIPTSLPKLPKASSTLGKAKNQLYRTSNLTEKIRTKCLLALHILLRGPIRRRSVLYFLPYFGHQFLHFEPFPGTSFSADVEWLNSDDNSMNMF